MSEKRFALLIDADNISKKYIKYILNELSKYGTVTIKRIYGDWTNNDNSGWKTVLLDNSITPIQQYSYTTGKNSTDSAMIIDAMDILYTGQVEGFCLASSDSDFTRLASRLREAGMNVIGMGENKTPKAFRVACDRFTCLEILLDQESADSKEEIEENTSKKSRSKSKQRVEAPIDKRTIESVVVSLITNNSNSGKTTGLGEIGSTLVKMYPDFDVRNYGYSLLSKFLEEFQSLKLKKVNSTVTVDLMDNSGSREQIELYAVNCVAQKGEIPLGDLSNKLHLQFRDFNIRDFGYTTFAKYIQNIPALEVFDGPTKEKLVRMKENAEAGTEL
jgi:uncharacterized LabA/DUF88 family protein